MKEQYNNEYFVDDLVFALLLVLTQIALILNQLQSLAKDLQFLAMSNARNGIQYTRHARTIDSQLYLAININNSDILDALIISKDDDEEQDVYSHSYNLTILTVALFDVLLAQCNWLSIDVLSLSMDGMQAFSKSLHSNGSVSRQSASRQAAEQRQGHQQNTHYYTVPSIHIPYESIMESLTYTNITSTTTMTETQRAHYTVAAEKSTKANRVAYSFSKLSAKHQSSSNQSFWHGLDDCLAALHQLYCIGTDDYADNASFHFDNHRVTKVNQLVIKSLPLDMKNSESKESSVSAAQIYKIFKESAIQKIIFYPPCLAYSQYLSCLLATLPSVQCLAVNYRYEVLETKFFHRLSSIVHSAIQQAEQEREGNSRLSLERLEFIEDNACAVTSRGDQLVSRLRYDHQEAMFAIQSQASLQQLKLE